MSQTLTKFENTLLAANYNLSNRRWRDTYEYDAQLPKYIISDEVRIKQVSAKLLSDAFKFTEDGFIKIVATNKKGKGKSMQLQLKVIDSGIGIAKEKQEFIFKLFCQ